MSFNINSFKLEGRRALITGSGQGIGLELARGLGAAGATVVINTRNIDKSRAVAAQLRDEGLKAESVAFDVTDREQLLAAINTFESDVGAIDILVNNAGIQRRAPLEDFSASDWHDVMRTNLDGFYNVLHPVMMPMIRRRKAGRIVCITSVSGLIGNRGQVNYSASKAGLIGAAKALAIELGKRKITVNCVAPGLIDTAMLDENVPVEELMKMIPAQRMGTPEEVAGAVNFLMSGEAGYITRQVLAVNGGLC